MTHWRTQDSAPATHMEVYRPSRGEVELGRQWLGFFSCIAGRVLFFPALPIEYETLSVNYWNFDEKES